LNFRKQRRKDPMIRLPIAALIDVVLFLLLYFIMAGTLAASEGELPSALTTQGQGSGGGSGLAPQVLRVERSATGGGVVFRLGANGVSDQAALRALLEKLPKEPGIVLRASDDVSVEAAAAALQAVRDAGFSRLSYATTR
jgi:biopolymer transport protein ExbD